ncbi:MAG: cold shock domain-containing protein [Bacteroidales bacterium]|jgi:cold shock CspA family protein|nr:cold shock domain-containing protein [Bacteroidales bacterium]
MARPTSFNKRENEKKKLSKRIEKQKRKEERKAAPTKSFDDMIAYVDENGMISDAPPETTEKEEINVEDIAISVPKKVDEETIRNGKVEYFNYARGYGFIKDSESAEKFFFHIKNSPAGIQEGDTVSFEFQKGSGKKDITNIHINNR